MEIRDLINALDNDTKIVDQKFDGFLVWPCVRYTVLQHLIDKKNNLDAAAGVRRHLSFIMKIKGIITALLNCPFFGPKKSILIMHTETSNVFINQKGHFNRIVDYFLEVDPTNTWKIEEHQIASNSVPKFYKSYSKLSFDIFLELVYRFVLIFNRRKADQAESHILELFSNVNSHVKHYNLQLDDVIIQRGIIKRIIKSRPAYTLYKKLFRLKGVKKLLIEDGYYGLDKSIIIKAAKDSNVKVLEPQHGFVNENHPAYNYGAKIIENKYFKAYLPDLYLSYGRFWANSISIPNATYVLGNPHLEYSINKVAHVKPLKKILVLGSGVTIAETQALLSALIASKPVGYDLYYRPHPQERDDIESRYGVQMSQGVGIDKLDLYSSLAEAKVIVGELTTAIFEAIALNKIIYLFNSSYTTAYYNSRIKYFIPFSLDSVSVVFEGKEPEVGGKEYYWEMDWKNSYSKLDSIIV